MTVPTSITAVAPIRGGLIVFGRDWHIVIRMTGPGRPQGPQPARAAQPSR